MHSVILASLVLTLAATLAFCLGFAAHKAGLCMVKAAAEFATSQEANLLAGFAKTSVWSLAAILAAGLIAGDIRYQTWPLSWQGLLGGLIFGIGAAFNGGCVFSSLARLADGKVALLAAIAMWPVGMAVAKLVSGSTHNLASTPYSAFNGVPGIALGILFIALIFWAVSQVRLIAKNWSRNSVSHMTLSMAAAVIGLANGFIYINYQNWSFTSAAARAVLGLTAGSSAHPAAVWILLLSAFCGMLASSRRRGSLKLLKPGPYDLFRHALAGGTMGFGAAMIPGGNDALILYGIPFFSPHALPALLAIFAGIYLTFTSARVLGMTVPKVECRGDICLSQ